MPSNGPPLKIPLSIPDLSGNEAAYLAECVETNWVSTAGPFVGRFESMVADYVGAPFAVATSTGTSALHVALLVAGVRPGDEVLVSTLTFIAPANAIRYVGAHPVFVDASPNDWQMDAELVGSFLENDCEYREGEVFNRTSGRRVAAILPVHILGGAVDMAPLTVAAKRFGIPIVEDATEGLGARYGGRPVGTLGDIGCYSFNGNKMVTCGGGGMIVTAKKKWAERARHLTTQAKKDPVESVHDEIGFNYRLTNLQAALGCAQMERIDQFISARRKIAERYKAFCQASEGVEFMPMPANVESVCWLSAIALTGKDRMFVADRLLKMGIESRPLWQPLHNSPAHKGAAVLGGGVAEEIQKCGICLPSSASLTGVEQAEVLSALRDLLE